MPTLIAAIVALVFALLSLIHLYWAMGGRTGKSAAVPQVSGRVAFVPSRLGTLMVAVGLAVCALLVARAGHLVPLPIASSWAKWLCIALALVLLTRAIGDFRLVGFFKRVRGTPFARLDTAVFAPLCLLLSAGVFYVATANVA